MGRHEFPGAVAAHDQDDAMRRQISELLTQLDLRRGPLPGDPFEPELWMDEAAGILAAVARG